MRAVMAREPFFLKVKFAFGFTISRARAETKRTQERSKSLQESQEQN
jgi:hypothetical protein